MYFVRRFLSCEFQKRTTRFTAMQITRGIVYDDDNTLFSLPLPLPQKTNILYEIVLEIRWCVMHKYHIIYIIYHIYHIYHSNKYKVSFR